MIKEYCYHCGKELTLITPWKYINPIKNLKVCKPQCNYKINIKDIPNKVKK